MAKWKIRGPTKTLSARDVIPEWVELEAASDKHIVFFIRRRFTASCYWVLFICAILVIWGLFVILASR